MGLFGKKKDRVIDLTEKYHKEKERIENLREGMQESTTTDSSSEPAAPGIFGMFGEGNPSTPVETSSETSIEERKRKLAKRLSDMTEKMEDLSNQIYKLQQRVELLERKSRVDY